MDRVERGTRRVTLVLALVLTACGGAEQASPDPSFDVAGVRGSFEAECADPFVVDELFCDQVDLAGLAAAGTILIVPTTLNAAAQDRADVICQTFARAHFDGDGNDLGYETIGVRDRDGGNAAACTV